MNCSDSLRGITPVLEYILILKKKDGSVYIASAHWTSSEEILKSGEVFNKDYF